MRSMRWVFMFIMFLGLSACADFYTREGSELRSPKEKTQDAGTQRAVLDTEVAGHITATAAERETATAVAESATATIPFGTQTAIAQSKEGIFPDKSNDGIDCKSGELSSEEIPPYMDLTWVKGEFNEEIGGYVFLLGFDRVDELDNTFSGAINIRNAMKHEFDEADKFINGLGNNRVAFLYVPGEGLEVTRSEVISQEEGWREVSGTSAVGSVEGNMIRLEVPLEEVIPQDESDNKSFFSFFTTVKDTNVCDMAGDDAPTPIELPPPPGDF